MTAPSRLKPHPPRPPAPFPPPPSPCPLLPPVPSSFLLLLSPPSPPRSPFRALEHFWQDGEHVFAFFDDVYFSANFTECTLCTVCSRPLCGASLAIRLHQGKTRAWNRGSIAPEDIEDISPEAWPAGINVLGTPIGSDQFVADKMSERRERESSGTVSRLFRTSSVRGSFSYRAQLPEQTTPCARCRPQFPGFIVTLTTQASGARQRL